MSNKHQHQKCNLTCVRCGKARATQLAWELVENKMQKTRPVCSKCAEEVKEVE